MLSRATLKFQEEFNYGKAKSKDKCCGKCADNVSFKTTDSKKCLCHGMYHLKNTLFDTSEVFDVKKDYVCKCFNKRVSKKKKKN